MTAPSERPGLLFLGLRLTGGRYSPLINIIACVSTLGIVAFLPLWLLGVPLAKEVLMVCSGTFLLLGITGEGDAEAVQELEDLLSKDRDTA